MSSPPLESQRPASFAVEEAQWPATAEAVPPKQGEAGSPSVEAAVPDGTICVRSSSVAIATARYRARQPIGERASRALDRSRRKREVRSDARALRAYTSGKKYMRRHFPFEFVAQWLEDPIPWRPPPSRTPGL